MQRLQKENRRDGQRRLLKAADAEMKYLRLYFVNLFLSLLKYLRQNDLILYEDRI